MNKKIIFITIGLILLIIVGGIFWYLNKFEIITAQKMIPKTEKATLQNGNLPLSVFNPIPQGVFSFTPGDKSVPPEILSNEMVAGVSLRISWQDVEKQEGNYNWSYLDKEISRAQKAGKVVLLRVVSGGRNIPIWLFAKGIQPFSFIDQNPYHKTTYGQKVTIPVFWDPVFLELKKRLIRAAGEHFAQNPTVRIIGASCANATTDDWNVPHSPEDVANWRVVGYTSEKMINACKEIIDTTTTAFPNQRVTMAVGSIPDGLDLTADYVAQQVVTYAREHYPGRFMVQKNSLSAKTPSLSRASDLKGGWKIIFDNRPEIAGQMLWFVTNDSTCRMNGKIKPCDPLSMLRQAVNIGLDEYQMQYIEIYQRDILNPELASVIKSAAERFLAYRSPRVDFSEDSN